MKKVKFHSDQNKTSLQEKEKENQCHGITTNIKKPKKLMREKQGNNLFMHSNSLTH